MAAGLLVAMAGAWYWAFMPSVPAPPVQTGGRAALSRPASAVPAVGLDRLAAHDVRPVPEPGRNPFQSGAAPRVALPVGERSVAPAAGPSSSSGVVAAPTWPRLDLIGVAEAREAGAVVRTAILAGPRGVQHARVGDVVEQVYRVDRIADRSVEVRLLPEQRTLRLALRP